MTPPKATPNKEDNTIYPIGYKTNAKQHNYTSSGIKFRHITPQDREKLRIPVYNYIL